MAKSRTATRKPATVVAPPPAQAPAVRQLTAEEVAALVASWDAARTEVRDAGEAVSQLQEKLDALAPDADRTALDAELLAAQARVTQAQATIEALTPLPEGVKLPDAPAKTNTEGTTAAAVASPAEPAAAAVEPALAAGTEGSLTQPAATHTTESDDGQEGGAGNAAGPAADGPSFDRDDDLDAADVARAEFGWQLDSARRMAVDGSIEEARDFLLERRAEVTLMATLTAEFAAALDAEIAALAPPAAELAGKVTVTAKAPSRWRIGRQFTREATTFQPGELTTEQLTTLQADHLIDVVVTE